MKIAWFTPFSRNSAIGAFSAAIIQELSQMADVTIFASDLLDTSNAWLQHKELFLLAKLELAELCIKLGEYDVVVYNLGDNLNFHRDIYRMAVRYPGIVILHDLVMHHFFSGYYFNYLGDPEGYVRELEYAHGVTGRELGEQVIKGKLPGIWEDQILLEYHMAKSAIRNAYGVIVHSRFAMQALEKVVSAPLIQIHFPLFGVSQRVDVLRLEKREIDKVHLLTYGMLNRNKMVSEVIEIIGKSEILRERVIYTVLGSSIQSEVDRLNKIVSENKLNGQVRLLVGWRSDEELVSHIANADIIMSLRNPHFGESSSVLHESMAMGKTTVVWKHGYYDEVPDDAVVKVNSLPSLQNALEYLSCHGDVRQQLGERAEKYAHQTFVTEVYCASLLEFAKSVRYNKPLLDLVDFSSKILGELGIDSENDELIGRLSREITNIMGN